ncbi:MAG TPA: hypothetical protein PLT08_00790 [Anaerolineales bacterium]|nr:hypothetical protein [Anaerolineales bacterium]
MDTYPNINLDKYYFIDQGNLFDRFNWWITLTLMDPIMPLSVYRPTIYKKKRTIWKLPRFRDVAKLIGLYNMESDSYLGWHNRRLGIFMTLLFFSEVAISLSLIMPFAYGLPGLMRILLLLSGNINLTITLLLAFCLLLLTYRIAFTMSTLLLERKFAETLCIMQITYILLELTRQDVIRSRKHDLLNRINFLANKLILMGMNYAGNDEVNKKWAFDLFNKMSRFVRERERLVIAPTENSLEQLRQDFFRLGKIIASGNYGSFEFEAGDVEITDQRPKSLSSQIFIIAIRVLSVAIPIFILIFMFNSTEAFDQLNINRDSVFYISIAWLLFALDDLIGIGIIEKFLNLVKVSKELR